MSKRTRSGEWLMNVSVNFGRETNGSVEHPASDVAAAALPSLRTSRREWMPYFQFFER
jgi:hypothetical protein